MIFKGGWERIDTVEDTVRATENANENNEFKKELQRTRGEIVDIEDK